MFVYVFVCMVGCSFVCSYVFLCIFICIFVCIPMYFCMYVRMYSCVFLYVLMYVRMYSYVFLYVCSYSYVCQNQNFDSLKFRIESTNFDSRTKKFDELRVQISNLWVKNMLEGWIQNI